MDRLIIDVFFPAVFLHRNEYTQAHVEVGQEVQFAIMVSDRGQPRAVSVHAVGAEPPAPAPMSSPGAYGRKGAQQYDVNPGTSMAKNHSPKRNTETTTPRGQPLSNITVL